MSNIVFEKFKDLKKDNIIECTQNDLDEFIMYGLLFKTGNNYITRDKQTININLIEPKQYKFNINLSSLIDQCNELSSKYKIKRIYCMTSRCYNTYKEKGYIVTINNIDYYRIFDKELWLVNILD